MKLSFVIVNYQSEKYLAKCIASVQEKVLGVEYEIIVVNNSNLEAELPSEIKSINSGKNIGFGAACNLGAKSAQGKILCFLNPDTEIVSENISELVQEFNNTNIGIVGPRLVDEKNNTQEWIAGKEVTILSTLLNNLGYKRDENIWESTVPVECAWVSGAAMFIRKDIFQKLGGFDEKFFMYFEDIDLCRRARQAEYKVLYLPSFIVKHLGGRSFFNKKLQKRYYHASQYRYFRKRFCL
jgi:GT2 family glycosyltransferase